MALSSCLSWFHNLCGPSVAEVRTRKKQENKLVEHPSLEVNKTQVVVDLEKRKSLKEVAERIAREFEFTDHNVRQAVEGFVKQMHEGLSSHGCSIEQLPSFITEIPTGIEKGTYLALDLGGTNIRVCSVTLNGNGTYSMIQDKVAIPVVLMTGTSQALFSWVAIVVRDFLKNYHLDSLASDFQNKGAEERFIFNLGFTFSHAVNQLDIKSGTLIRWSKGFDIGGVVGQDVCAILQNAFTELALPVRVTALINDTVGTLMARAYVSPEFSISILGAVFGTGTNGAYVEQTARITKLPSSSTDRGGILIINSEWGNFDQKLEYLPTTAYDKAIDTESVNPGVEMFEKRISGMYLGEILRLVIVSLINDPQASIFSGLAIPETSSLLVQWGLDSSFMSHLESDTTPDLSLSITQIKQWTGIKKVSFEDAQAIRIISHAIGRRSARLSAVALGAVLVKTGCLEVGKNEGKGIDIGVDGSLIELYPGFVTEIRRALGVIREIGNGEERIDIVVTKDGSGVGAALAAHAAARILGC